MDEAKRLGPRMNWGRRNELNQTSAGPTPSDPPEGQTPSERALFLALQEADRRKDELLAALGHELRNPMSALAASVGLLRQENLPPEKRQRALDLMERQIYAMSSTVDDLLELSRLNRGRITLERQILDLGCLVSCTLEDRRAEFESQGLELSVQLPDGPVRVNGDPARLGELLMHLVTHAARSAPGADGIQVHLAREGLEARLSVCRGGSCLAPESPDPFEPFGRLVAGTSGLGLSLARGIAELHGGSARALSPGTRTGLCLEIRLPLAPEPEKGLDVLIVEDDPDSAELMALLLESLGHRPRTAHDGPHALQAVQDALPDVVFCDLGLPAPLDGCTVARMLRQEPGGEDLLLVALTGSGSERDRVRSRQAGFDLHLVKPASPEQLHSLLATRPPRAPR